MWTRILTGIAVLCAQGSLAFAATAVSIAASHAGSFTQGQAGAQYSIAVTNQGPGKTAGTLTVKDTLPPALVPVSIAGSGWTCNLTTVSCSRSDALEAGSSYPPVLVSVNVARDAPTGANAVTNVASVLGKSIQTQTADDPTTINPLLADAPVLNASRPDAFQVAYVSNLNVGDGVINVTNAGTSAGSKIPIANGNTFGDICVNVYVYAPDQEQAACCSCLVSPNSLHSWPVIFGANALLNSVNIVNEIGGGPTHSVVIKMTATAPIGANTANPTCDPTAQGTLVEGMQGWSSRAHATNATQLAITETPFVSRNLSPGEYGKLTTDCSVTLHEGGGKFCPACGLGGLAQPATGR